MIITPPQHTILYLLNNHYEDSDDNYEDDTKMKTGKTLTD